MTEEQQGKAAGWLQAGHIFKWEADSSEKFWANVTTHMSEMRLMSPKRRVPACEIRWIQLEYVAMESRGMAHLSVQRAGLTEGEVTVRVRTCEMMDVSNF